MMYTVAVALLLATGNAYSYSGTRSMPRVARALTMTATDVSTQAVLATVRFYLCIVSVRNSRIKLTKTKQIRLPEMHVGWL